MIARVTQYRIPPEKEEEFMSSVAAAFPHAQQQQGFRALMAFRLSSGATVEIRVISVWNSQEDLQAGEQNFYFYQALARCLTYTKGFPLIDMHEVLFLDFERA
jgi:heme-degrading monooxygenase HmoA